jgi:FKBP-type peptidyl-prolyl cis-trans isomerase
MSMRSIALFTVLGAVTSLVLAQGPATSPPPSTPATAPSAFKTDAERIGYAIGLQIGESLQGVEVDATALRAGIRDAAAGGKPQMTDAEIEATMMNLQKQIMTAKQQAGEKFLAENGKKDGVKTTASGLQYRVIKSGAGKTPKATDTVSVNYRGTLITGEEFDASKGTPVTFPVNGVIPGWTEALQLMKEGDKWEVVIPSKLAYGERGAGRAIAPNSTLVFEVELVAVKAGE